MDATSVHDLRKLWLEARCGSSASLQHASKMKEFLDALLRSLASRKLPDFKLVFGTGGELSLQICKEFSTHTQLALQTKDDSVFTSMIASEYHDSLTAGLLFLSNRNEFRTRGELALLSSTYEQMDNHNVASLIFLSHARLFRLARSGSINTDVELALMSDVKHLSLALRVLQWPLVEVGGRSRAEGKTSAALVSTVSTFVATSAVAFRSSHEMSETALALFRQQLTLTPAVEAISAARQVLEEALATPPTSFSVSSSGLHKNGNENTEVLDVSGVLLAGVVCALEAAIAAAKLIGFRQPESINFPSVTAGLLALEQAVAAHPGLGQRLATCLHSIAIAPRKVCQSEGSNGQETSGFAVAGAKGLLKFVPGSLGKIQRKIADALGTDTGGGGTPSDNTMTGVSCREVVESLTTLFVCSTSEATSILYGTELFGLLSLPGVSDSITTFVLQSCLDSLGELHARQLGMVLKYTQEHRAAPTAASSPFVKGVVKAMESCALRSFQCRGIVVDFFIAFCSRDGRNTSVLLSEGLLGACVSCLPWEATDGLECTVVGRTVDDAPLQQKLKDLPTAVAVAAGATDDSSGMGDYVQKLSVLSKVLVRHTEAAEPLERDHTPTRLLECALWAEAHGLPKQSRVLLDMFVNCLLKTGHFYGVLLTSLASRTAKGVWEKDTSLLLATLALVLRTGKHVDSAVEGNGVELCLTLTREIQHSQSPAADLFCLGVCLRFMLLPLRQSDVWPLFDASVGTMTRSRENVQFVLNLCDGYYGMPETLDACGRYAKTLSPLSLAIEGSSNLLTFGDYTVPSQPFLELEHVFSLLLRWASEELESDGGDNEKSGDNLAAAAEAVLLRTPGAALSSDVLAPFIVRWGRIELLRCVRDVTTPALRDLLFDPPGYHTHAPRSGDEDENGVERILCLLSTRQQAWNAALLPLHRTPSESRHSFTFGSAGGATGTVVCSCGTGSAVLANANYPQWPPSDGLSVAAWVNWRSTMHVSSSDSDGDGDVHGSASSASTSSSVSTGRVRGGVVWLLEWGHCSMSFSVCPSERSCSYTYRDDGANAGSSAMVLELPFIPPDTWVHVTVCLSKVRGQLRTFYDGALVSAVDCPYPRSSAASGLSAAVTGLFTDQSCRLRCTVGASRTHPPQQMTLRFLSFLIYNHALDAEEASAIYCMGQEQGGNGDADEVSLLQPYLGDEVIRAVGVQRGSGTLDSLCRAGTSLSQRHHLPSQRSLFLGLYAQRAALVAGASRRFSSTCWALRAETAATTPIVPFGLHGAFTTPNCAAPSLVDAFLARGAMLEWLEWMHCVEMSPSTNDAAKLAHGLLRIVAAASKQTHLSDSSWRRFVGRLTEHVVVHPQLYLSNEEAIRVVLSLSVRPIKGTCVAGEKDLLESVVYFTTPLEHIVFNWRILLSLLPGSLQILLSILEELLCAQNPYREFNALRFRSADFINGFIVGLTREYAGLTPLPAAFRVIFLFLQSLSRRPDVIGEVLSVCLLTIPVPDCTTAEHRLSSKLLRTSMEYIVLVRNLLLRTVCDVWDAFPASARVEFSHALGRVTPKCCFALLVSASSHPVTVALSLRIFVMTYFFDAEFRSRFKGDEILFLVEPLASHAHEVGALSILFQAFQGHVVSISNLELPEVSVDAYRVPDLDQLLLLVLNILKRRSQIMLQGVSVLPRDVSCAAYFAACAAQTSDAAGTFTLSETKARKKRLRHVVYAIVFCHRLQKQPSQGRAVEIGEVTSVLTLPDTVPAREYFAEMQEGTCRVLDWLSAHYRSSAYVRTALYRSSKALNLIDLAAWPLLCSLHSQINKPQEAATETPKEQRNSSFSATATEEQQRHHDGVDVDADDDDEWEVLPAVVQTQSRSTGLDVLAPSEGLEELYDACRALYLAHAAECAVESEMVALAPGRMKLRKFVLALHKSLSTTVRRVGNEAEDCRCAFLCTVWMKAAEQSVDSFSGNAETAAVKNAVALAKYVLDRLVSGSAVPPLAIAGYYKFLLMRLDGSRDVVRTVRTSLFEWMTYLMSPAFHCQSPSRAMAAIEAIYTCEDILLAVPMPSEDLLRVVVNGLLDLSLTYACSAELEGAPVERKLAALWLTLRSANASAPVFASAGTGTPHGVGTWSGWGSAGSMLASGLELLLPPIASRDRFLGWMRSNRVALLQQLGSGGLTRFEYTQAEGGKYLKMLRRSTHNAQKRALVMKAEMGGAKEDVYTRWTALTSILTYVDSSVLRQCRRTFLNSCVVRAELPSSVGNGSKVPLVQGQVEQSWCLLHCGSVGLRPHFTGESVDDLTSEPIHHFVRHVPLLCLPLHTAVADEVDRTSSRIMGGSVAGAASATQELPSIPAASSTSVFSPLRPNAAQLMRKIAGPLFSDRVQWAGNVYYVVGSESHICSLIVTQVEVLIISCSQVTPSGDFFIAEVRPHAATQHSQLKNSFVPQALRRLLPNQSIRATNSKAAFRYSQYYRQLRSESAQGAAAVVWRFALSSIAVMHERLFQHLPTALEFVLETGERFLVVVLDDELSFSKGSRDRLMNAVGALAPRVMTETMSSKRSQLHSLTRRWATRSLSTASYLSGVNDTASRTTVDIGQYPIMPWVLCDYCAGSLDTASGVKSCAPFRDLATPIGALNPVKAAQLARRYADWDSESSNPPFHHGTHYSSAAVVLYYLLRLQPFTSRSVRFQGGRLDIADRLFHSVAEAWESGCGPGGGDVKELVPEFYQLADVFVNRNDAKLGTRRDGVALNDVVLPPWAHDRPSFFVHLNRMALESEAVSEGLSDWLDLIFGFKQQGEDAVRALNVFHHLSYQEGVERAISSAANEADCKAIVASADSFGQTPLQVFGRNPHIRRVPRSAATIMQDYITSNVKHVYVASTTMLSCVVLGARRGYNSFPVCEVRFGDDCFYGVSSRASIALQRPMSYFSYDSTRNVLENVLVREGRIAATLPPIESFGCGALTAVAAAPSGNIVCVGTESGSVIVFGRRSQSGHFFVTAILHPPSDAENAVYSLRLFNNGSLIVTYEKESLVCGWQLSCFVSMFCFSLRAEAANDDDTPVAQVTMDTQTRVYFGAKAFYVVLFTGSGELLSTFDIRPTWAAAVDMLATSQIGCHITALAMCNCESFSPQNLFLLGHANGYMSFWVIEATTSSQNYTHPYTARLVHTIILESAIRSIYPVVSEYAIGVGLANGKMTIVSFPHPEVEDA